jgi:2,4-dienoyl-CoA reductase-like NADH-dependent reductase (Old Yellow Enzyme family)
VASAPPAPPAAGADAGDVVPTSQLPHVWQPLDIGPTRVKHRVMYTAQTILYADDHILSDRHIAFYRERAMGGAALLITEQQAAHRLSKGSFYQGCTAWEKRVIPQYAKLADAVHEFGARQFAQLFACGVHDKGTLLIDDWHPLWGVSRTPSIVHREVPMVMEKEHVRDVVRGYGESALNVKVAGLDGVEIHAAHSYLVGQFLSRAYNKRTDDYGGSVRKRCQFPIEAAEEIRRQVGDAITVGIRLSFDEFMGDAGITQEEAEEQIEIMASTGLFDYFSISGGGYHTLHMAVAPMNVPEGFMVPFGRRAKEIVGDRAKVFIVGRIIDVRMADKIVGDGDADMVAMTRAQMADPFLVQKALDDRSDTQVRCVGANVCLTRAFDQREVICVMNPAVGRERQLGAGTLQPAAAGRKVVVVGGGPAGMRLAATAAQRGHGVVLVEREDELGGHLRQLVRLPTRGAWRTGILNLAHPLAELDVDVRTGTEATPELLASVGADVVVCATGSHWDRSGQSPYRPEREGIPGADGPHVLDIGTATARALDDPLALGERVLLVDDSASYQPIGLAVLLSEAGVQIEIVTPHMFLGEDTLKTMDLFHTFPTLHGRNVVQTAQHFVERIDGHDAHLYCVWGGGQRVATADTIVLSSYKVPDDELYQSIRGRFEDVRVVGDALAPRKVEAVIYEAEMLARAL